MRVTHRTQNMDITVDGEDAKGCFDQLAKALEVFGQTRCGACDATEVTFVVRESDGFTFREAQCRECGCSLAFGMRKSDMSLFPRRKDKSGNWLDNRGWVKFQPKEPDAF